MKRLFIAAALLVCGCGLTEKENRPLPTPDDPKPQPQPVVKAPLEAFTKELAKRNDRKLIESPRELSSIVLQLVKSGDLEAADAAKIEAKFPGWLRDNRPMTSDDSKTLLVVK